MYKGNLILHMLGLFCSSVGGCSIVFFVRLWLRYGRYCHVFNRFAKRQWG